MFARTVLCINGFVCGFVLTLARWCPWALYRWENLASGEEAFVGGGWNNTSAGSDSGVSSGLGNSALGAYHIAQQALILSREIMRPMSL